MLYLVRKIGESIIINGNIEIKLVEVKGKSAKLGFEFPSTAQVLRKEIHDRIVAENIAAQLAHPGSDDEIAAAMAKVSSGNKEDKKDKKPEEE